MINKPSTLDTQIGTLPLSTISSNLDAQKAKIGAIPFSYSAGPSQGVAAAVTGIRAAVDALLNEDGQILAVHPWSQGVGEFGEGKYTQQLDGYLSPKKALNHISQKLLDPNDSAKNEAAEAICFYLNSSTLADFHNKLKSLNEAWPITDFSFAERRAKDLLDIESSKMLRKQDLLNPNFIDKSQNYFAKIVQIRVKSDALMGICEAHAEDVDPKAELSALIDAKKAEISAAETAWQNLLSSMVNAEGTAKFYSGSLGTMASAIAGESASDADIFCVGICLIGKAGDLGLFKEIFGL